MSAKLHALLANAGLGIEDAVALDPIPVDETPEEEVVEQVAAAAGGEDELVVDIDEVIEEGDEIADDEADIETSTDVVESLESLIASMESMIGEGGLNVAEYTRAQSNATTILGRLGVAYKGTISTEGLADATTRITTLKLGIEDLKSTAAAVWKSIKDAFFALIEKMGTFWENLCDGAGRMAKRFDALIKQAKLLGSNESKADAISGGAFVNGKKLKNFVGKYPERFAAQMAADTATVLAFPSKALNSIGAEQLEDAATLNISAGKDKRPYGADLVLEGGSYKVKTESSSTAQDLPDQLEKIENLMGVAKSYSFTIPNKAALVAALTSIRKMMVDLSNYRATYKKHLEFIKGREREIEASLKSGEAEGAAAAKKELAVIRADVSAPKVWAGFAVSYAKEFGNFSAMLIKDWEGSKKPAAAEEPAAATA